MAKIRKKYNPQKTLMYNLQKSIKIKNTIMQNELAGVIKERTETVAYLHKVNIVNDEVLSRLIDLTHLFEIISVYQEDLLHYNNHVKPQFKTDNLINLDAFIQEAKELKEIIEPLILQDKRTKIKLNKNAIELIENITNYVIKCLNDLKCRITFCEFVLYSKQQNKLFLLNYPKLYKYYKSTCSHDMIRSIKYRLNSEQILNKYLLHDKYALFDYEKYSFNFIDKKDLVNYKLTDMEGVVECVN